MKKAALTGECITFPFTCGQLFQKVSSGGWSPKLSETWCWQTSSKTWNVPSDCHQNPSDPVTPESSELPWEQRSWQHRQKATLLQNITRRAPTRVGLQFNSHRDMDARRRLPPDTLSSLTVTDAQRHRVTTHRTATPAVLLRTNTQEVPSHVALLTSHHLLFPGVLWPKRRKKKFH